jgi:hypothetical protein
MVAVCKEGHRAACALGWQGRFCADPSGLNLTYLGHGSRELGTKGQPPTKWPFSGICANLRRSCLLRRSTLIFYVYRRSAHRICGDPAPNFAPIYFSVC